MNGEVHVAKGETFSSIHRTDMRLQAVGQLASFVLQEARASAASHQTQLQANECDKSRMATDVRCRQWRRQLASINEVISTQARTVLVGVRPGRTWENGKGRVVQAFCFSRENVRRAIPLPQPATPTR